MIKSACKDNRGLTLVELIVSITILAIIVVPLLHNFVMGASIENKSRKYGDATDTAQNLSEQIQAVDADTILDNAGAVASGASFYTLSGTAIGTKAPDITEGEDKIYYIRIPNYSYDYSSFDALVTLDATDATNNTAVVVGNKMDAMLDMTEADLNASLALKAQCGDLVEDIGDLNMYDLTRKITFNVFKTIDSSTDTYEIDVLFDYTGTISYQTDEGTDRTYFFTHTEKASASVGSVEASADGSPVFSVFMFFNAYYRDNMSSETILINNPTGSDVNTFLVNTNSGSMPIAYNALVWYKYQNFTDNKPVNDLVFTNLPADRLTYHASENDLSSQILSVSGYLAETKQLDRKFNINIKLFESGSNFIGVPILDLDSTKLNY